ncbi:hypothetical protein ABZ468_50490 [Streptomyces sp. NPDC005708]|uniref:hypothetical protein n=1 Tax=unclassified Streptomyces TaxID=2593676 RepID=UPI003406F33B
MVFAVYALFLLLALITAGGSSDFLGRKPVIIDSVPLEAASMLLFAEARGVCRLLAARAVQGLATGAATGPPAAALVELQPRRVPGLGALVNSAASSGGRPSARSAPACWCSTRRRRACRCSRCC